MWAPFWPRATRGYPVHLWVGRMQSHILDQMRVLRTVCSDASPTLSYSRMALYSVLSRWDARTTFRVSGGTSATPVLNTLCRTLSWASRGDNLSTTIARVIVVSAKTEKSHSLARKSICVPCDKNVRPRGKAQQTGGWWVFISYHTGWIFLKNSLRKKKTTQPKNNI